MKAMMAALAALVVTPAVAHPQYFGRNKVQYQAFDFRVLQTEHFDVHYYPEERAAAELAARMAERWYARLSVILADTLDRRQPLILYASHAHFQQTNAIAGEIGEGTGGVTESFKRRIVLPFTQSLAEVDHVVGHELVHAFQFDITGRGRSAAPGALRLPLWFIEGMAEYLTLGPVDPHTAMWLRDAVQRDALPGVGDLDHPRYFPYRWGHAFWAYVGGRWGDEMVGRILRVAARGGDPIAALRATLELDPDTLSAQWHAAMRAAYQPLAAGSEPPGAAGRALLTEETTGGRLSLAPALSPDGSRIAFLSERDQFAVELFVADAVTGQVQRRLTRSALDPHLESLQFIHSAGAWHPDGRRLAVAAMVRGRPALQVLDVDQDRRDREIVLGELDEVLNPSWSPDGRLLVFTGQVGGLTDLFTYDLEAGQLRRLTTDPYADLHPAWSPDGRTIAFTTDRFGADLSDLTYGAYRIGLLDVRTGQVRPATEPGRSKQINPQWGADGRSLYFLGDPDGITNVYRLDLATGALFQLTDLFTGASGITALSPALATAQHADRLAVSVFRDGRYEVYSFDGAPALAGRPARASAPAARAAALPPGDGAGTSRVAAYLRDAATGLPRTATFAERPYRSRFGVDYIAQPYVTAGADRFGSFVGGGASLYWSSMLGDQQLVTGLQVNGGFADIAALAGYTNLRHRLDWGVSAAQIPYVTGGYSRSVEDVGGQPALVQRELRQRQTSRQVAVSLAYPFSRAQRVELIGGVRHISFDAELREIAVSQNGTVLFDRRTDLATSGALTVGEAAAALVYDNAIFGGTGPVLGQRYRLEAAPTVGALTFVTALADVRKYVMPVRPVTLALRALHYGRYGRDGEDPRLAPLFLGYQGLVRGYDNGSFDPSECVPSGAGACPVFDRLVGSRILVGNAELRLPVLGPLGVLSRRGFPPVDLALFADGGAAWTDAETPALFGGTRRAVGSVGAAARFNLFGVLIGELAYVRPLDRPNKGWFLQFGLTPGF